ncbi:MAG: dienelactone hydrolase family protein [Acidimicrobiia bacterium]|nr:dienelactone hydrolase family protein [Acidimicrobiia bacterium]
MSDSAYFISPVGGPGPGLLLLHSWWGLTWEIRRLADRLADEGYTVLAPDLNGGATFTDQTEAEQHLAEADANRLAHLTSSSVKLLSERAGRPRVGVVGLSMGASLGLWASVRMPEEIGAVAGFYGAQSIDFAGASAAYQLHYAGVDDLVDRDEAALMEATIALEGLSLDVHRYPGAGHWFFEEGRPEHDPVAAELAWERTCRFLSGAVPGV